MAHPLLAATLVWLAAPAAHADDRSAARLYNEGWQLYKDKQYAEACPLLERSLAASPMIRTRGALAQCYEASGKYASAYNTWRAVAEQAAEAGAAEAATLKHAVEKTEQLVARITRIVFEPAAAATGLQVWLDGRLLAGNELNVPLPVDPGVHTIEAKAPDRVDWKSTFEIAATEAGTTRSLPIEPLAPIQPAHVDTPPPPEVEKPPPATPEVEKPPRPPRPRLQYAAVASASAGLVAVAVGTIYAFSARSSWHDAKSLGCDGHGVCRTQKGVDLVNKAGSRATIGTIALVAGVALIGGGGAMWFLAPSPGKPEPAVTPDVSVGPGGVHVSLGGTF
ncbi:MAG TPA: hypothetical protein VHW23_32395 [Kofleriaceae bacterium]|nr:hypothetical protein [Kofleriaceae bacterium]